MTSLCMKDVMNAAVITEMEVMARTAMNSSSLGRFWSESAIQKRPIARVIAERARAMIPMV